MKHTVKISRLRFVLFVLLLSTWIAAVPFFPYSVQAQEKTCSLPFQAVATPLIDLGNNAYVRMDGQVTKFSGGLYPDGSNTRPPKHEAAGLAMAAQITPLNLDGQPDPKGRIVMISIGMSNVESEFGNFMSMAHKDRSINPKLAFINGALGGQTAEKWESPDALPWTMLKGQLSEYHFSPEQVQVAWVKETLTRGGDFPAKAEELENYLVAIVHNLKATFPNIKIVYLSSRTRSYTYWRGLSPEPVAYETGFAVKWLIEKQLNGDPSLNFDPALGEVNTPYLSWGPYLWIDGTNPRSDGRVWTAEDMADDCTHPSRSGNIKVAEMLMEFFKHDTLAASWFLAGGTMPSQPSATPVGAIAPASTKTPIPMPTLTPPPVPTQTPSPASQVPASAQISPTVVAATSKTAAPPAGTPVGRYVFLVVIISGAGLASGWFLLRKK